MTHVGVIGAGIMLVNKVFHGMAAGGVLVQQTDLHA
jgi:hypothetical protein